MQTPGKIESQLSEELKARYSTYQSVLFHDENKELMEGDVINDTGIFRFHRGRLHGHGTEPAIELHDGHIEFWKCGVMHNGSGAAITALDELYKEFYLNGQITTEEKVLKG
jgi:hypothetical protein